MVYLCPEGLVSLPLEISANTCILNEPYISIVVCSAPFLGLFLSRNDAAASDYRAAPATAWVAFAFITLFGCLLSLVNIGTSVAIERDWVTQISLGQGEHSAATLTRLNGHMRRIDLLSKLLAPLFTSLLTTAASYTFAVAFLMGLAVLTLVFELWWLGVVYRRFPALAEAKKEQTAATASKDLIAASEHVGRAKASSSRLLDRLLIFYRDWREFSQMPVFVSSVSISLIYLTVLSSVAIIITSK